MLNESLEGWHLKSCHKLKENFGLNPIFEGGEAETFVTDCPLFKKKIVIKKFAKQWDNKTGSGNIIVLESSLEPK